MREGVVLGMSTQGRQGTNTVKQVQGYDQMLEGKTPKGFKHQGNVDELRFAVETRVT
jgi:hypothetical protein